MQGPLYRHAGRSPGAQRRSVFAVVSVTLVLVIVVVSIMVWHSRSAHAGGDPGGRMLRELEPALAAVPSSSTNVVTHRLDSTWSPKCPDNPGGKAGWSAVLVDATFTSTQTARQISSSVGAALTRAGWTRHDETFGPEQGPVAHWTKRLRSGVGASAAVYPVPAGSSHWALTASAQPPGYALPGC